jgi:hypothetical protein
MADEAGGEGEEALARELGRQAEAADEAFREAAVRLLREGEIDPRLLVLAMARVTGEMAAATVLACGAGGDALLADVLEVVGRACREHGEVLEAMTGPAAGNA